MSLDKIPQSHRNLLSDSVRAFAYLATLMPEGSPQLTKVWFNLDDTHVLINSAEGRIKDKNMRGRPQVALLIADPSNDYRYIQIRGQIIEFTEEGARNHINTLSAKYRGVPEYPVIPGEVRVSYKIEIGHVSVGG
jgi:PPOX class probable F420-dependent enzyme